jgi:hypothetical protein
MAVRTAYVPVAATAITAANHIKFPGGWIGYVDKVADQTGFTSTADVSSLSVTVTAGSTRRLKVSGYTRVLQNTSASTATVLLRDGSSAQLQAWQATLAIAAVTTMAPQVIVTPSSGSNTYKMSATTAAGTLDISASNQAPAFVLVEDLGPAS